MLLEGKTLKKEILNKCKDTIANNNLNIVLTIICSINIDDANKTYVNSKVKACEKVGIKVQLYYINPTLNELIKTILECQINKAYNGIIVQLPFGNIPTKEIARYIPVPSDVDGITSVNMGALQYNDTPFCTIPATAKGIIKLLDYYNIGIESKHCVIINRSNIVGLPLAQLMLHRNATVTICHSYTKNLKEICKTADILVVGVGKPNFINESFIKDKNTKIIDVGITRIDNKLVGDCYINSDIFDITPVPGGVGQLTTACLIENIVELALLHKALK